MATDPPSANQTMPAGERPTNVRWLIFALSCGTSFILYLHRYTWGFVKANVREEFGWSEWQLGWLDSVFSASYGFGQIPSGILCDWFGPHVLLGTIILLWSLSMGGVALATGISSMFGARILFGLTQAGAYPTLSKVTKLWFPLTVRTSVQGWIATFFGRGGGAMSFFLFGTVLIGWMGLSWRVSLMVLTAVGAVFAILFIWLFRNTPQVHPWANQAETDLVTEGDPEAAQATRSALRWKSVLKSRNMRFFFVQQFTSAYADNVFVYWIPLFLLTAKGVDIGKAGWMAALPLLGGAVGGMLGATLQNYLIIRTGNRRWSRSLIGLVGKLLATVFMFVSLGFDKAIVIVSIFFVVKFFSDWSQPTVWGTITDIAGRNAASVFATINTVGSIAGFIAGPTMGLMIMAFSEQIVVQDEVVLSAKTEFVDDGRAVKIDYANFEEMNVAGGTLSGIIQQGTARLARFDVSEDGDISFTLDGNEAAKPIAVESRFNRVRGRLSIVWDADPGETQLVVNYNYIDYTNGWNSLFITLGIVYLISSLAWLFIDCTIPLDVETAG